MIGVRIERRHPLNQLLVRIPPSKGKSQFKQHGLITVVQHHIKQSVRRQIADHIGDLVFDHLVTLQAALPIGHPLTIGIDHKQDTFYTRFQGEDADIGKPNADRTAGATE